MNYSSLRAVRACAALLIAGIAVALAGCSQAPPASAPAPAIEPLAQYMVRANEANVQGSKDQARALYYTAAKSYPTSKEPWQKLAQDYFETRNYGQAILAAQEVLLRDPSDTVSTSILAVSGLRVSAQGLTALRQQQRRLTGDTRTEAEDIARTLRELLGEPLLPPPVGAAGSASAPTPRPKPVARPKAASTATPAASVPPIATQKGDTPANPFNLLTK